MQRQRRSVFQEVGLENDLDTIDLNRQQSPATAGKSVADAERPSSGSITSLHSSKFLQLALLVVFCVALLPNLPLDTILSSTIVVGARAGSVIPEDPKALPGTKRQTDVCKRWAGQSALVNGTLYYYGGRATTSADQQSDTWNNNFIALDLTKSWQISTPSMTSLPSPSGPPPVALGYLWSSNEALYLYGGQFSDTPATSPVPFSLWSYNIASKSWDERQNQKFSDGEPVQRAAEGAGVSVPNLGKGYYFGGHLDGYTTAGWSQSVPRVYLQSLLEYDMSSGQYQNITTTSAGFPQRADGSLVYVPGYGSSGVILGLAGGTNQSFTQMNVIDVFDIAESKWYKQATSGTTPDYRVNPCTVALSAADGSSTQVYMYGGQNLVPAGEQKQYADVWILTIPSFTWMQVDTNNQAVPPARAGHTCNVWNSQMVVVGGYVGQDLACDSPGIYVFNTSSLTWQNEYYALGGDPLNRQDLQKDDPNAIQGSYNYQVPAAVQQIIGGNDAGGATATVPAQTPTDGPLVTGRPRTYTPTDTPSSGTGGGGGSGSGKSGTNVGAIVAGVIAGVLFIMALYLAFCAWVYRKQLKIYKKYAALMRETPPFEPYAAGRNYMDKRVSRSGDGSSSDRRVQSGSHNPYTPLPGTGTAASSTEDLMRGQEPSMLGIMLNPRRSLRVVNRD